MVYYIYRHNLIQEFYESRGHHRMYLSYIFLHPLTAGQCHSNLFKLACEACRRHYSPKGILRELSAFFEHTDFSIEELKSVLSSGYKQVNEQAPTSSPAAVPSRQTDKLTKLPYGTMENATSDDETYWQGEEFRKGTPLFSRDLYRNLPDLLEEIHTKILTASESVMKKKYRTGRSMLSDALLHAVPSVRPLKNPDTIRHFIEELPDTFTTDEALLVGAKYDFNNRKTARLLKALNGVRINRISHGSYTKMNDQ